MEIGTKVVQNPADMAMKETLHRAVRIHVIIGIGMVLDVGRGPVQGGPLKGHGSEDQKNGTDPIRSLEALVCQHPMIANGDPQGAEGIADQQNREIKAADHPAPEADNRIDGTQ